MTGAGNHSEAPLLGGYGLNSGALSGIEEQRHSGTSADFGRFGNRHQCPVDIGNVHQDNEACRRIEHGFEGPEVEAPGTAAGYNGGCDALGGESVKGANHGVVFHAGDQNAVAGAKKAFQNQVDALVAFFVKITWSVAVIPNSFAVLALHSERIDAASRACLCAPRPGERSDPFEDVHYGAEHALGLRKTGCGVIEIKGHLFFLVHCKP